ncbi:MAG: hypothetical protein QOD94_1847 [Alphaproteobacteria bacterium]|nr:hypothetical protein [Alphaproteobacteria bacterium]
MTNWRGVSAHLLLSEAKLDKMSDLFDSMA